MFPLTHILTSVSAVLLYMLFHGIALSSDIVWLFAAAIFTVVMDFDHILYPLLRKENRHLALKAICSPLQILADLKGFRDAIHFPGLGVLRILFHIIWGSILTTAVYLSHSSLTVPAVISLSTHIVVDIAEMIMYPERL
ncbi:MAG: hypothetical protein V1921_02155 [Candidatus Altiarchaeota archaeon]